MANICENELRAYNLSSQTAKEIQDWFLEKMDIELEVFSPSSDDQEINAFFESRWTFPDDLMADLYNYITDKENLDMACLSVEWGCFYCAFHTCDKNGWRLEE